MGSNYLYILIPGDDTQLTGAYGNFTLPMPLNPELIMIARYTGLVPIRCMLKHLYAQRQTATILLIAVAPAEEELLFHQELLTLAVTHPGFRYLPLVAAGGEQQGVDLTLSMLRPLIDGMPKVIPMTWHVEQAQTPPQTCSSATPLPIATSKRLPGSPVGP